MLSFTRDGVASNAVLHQLVAAVSHLYWGQGGSDFEGDASAGLHVYDNGQGDRYAIAWDPGEVVALCFAHESDRSRHRASGWSDAELAKPDSFSDVLSGIELRGAALALARRAAVALGEPPTAGLHVRAIDATLSDPITGKTPFAHGLEMLAPYGMAARDALESPELSQPWAELMSLPPGTPELCVAWLERLAEGSTEVTEAERDQLLAAGQIDPRAVDEACAAMRAVGLTLTIEGETLEREREADHARRLEGAMSEASQRLFEAARANDVAALEQALADGGSAVARTITDQWESTPAGDTPLIQALRVGSIEAAERLVALGEGLAAKNEHGQSALEWAARRGASSLVESLCAAGVRLDAAGREAVEKVVGQTEGGREALATLDRWAMVDMLRTLIRRGAFELAEDEQEDGILTDLADTVIAIRARRRSRGARASAIAEAFLDHDGVEDLFLDDDALAATALCSE